MPQINENLYNTSDEEKLEIGKLPATFCEAKTVMTESEFVKGILPEVIISEYAK